MTAYHVNTKEKFYTLYDGYDIKRKMKSFVHTNNITIDDVFYTDYEKWYIISSVLLLLHNEEPELEHTVPTTRYKECGKWISETNEYSRIIPEFISTLTSINFDDITFFEEDLKRSFDDKMLTL